MAVFLYTNEMLAAEAEKYETRDAFQEGSRSAYAIAHARGIIDQICDHMVGISGSDDNAIYIWRAVGIRYNRKPVYRVGVTSARLRYQRIREVAEVAGMEAEIVILKKVDGRAMNLETKVLAIGNDPQFLGCTGFRAMDDEELAKALALIQES